VIYKVRARFKKKSASDLHRKLLDGTIANKKPDGPSIVEAMNRAVVKDSGEIEWSELCYCPSPLAHERHTVFDQHFDDIETEVIDDYQEHEGRSFMDHLSTVADGHV
jgi:hypothetical protein